MANNYEFDLYAVCNPIAQKKAAKVVGKQWIDFGKISFPQPTKNVQRWKAAEYFSKHFEREQRYLIIFARDFSEYQNSGEWLKSPDGRKSQKRFDFLCSFESLKEKMKEFRWSKEFLNENGIHFKELTKLYFALA